MKQYIIRRLFMTIFVVLGAAILIFTIMYFIPGDPAKLMLGSDASAEMIEAKREEMGLSDPYLIRLAKYLYNALHFNLGSSWYTTVPVAEELKDRLPRTMLLGTLCVVFGTVIAIPLGITAAVHKGKWQDIACMVAGMACVSMPDFWFALILVIIFSQTNILPTFGIGSWKNYVLPVISGSLHSIGLLARQTRSSMLDVYHSDYVTTARAKGVPENSVIYRHMLPNALIPIITVVGGAFARSIAGTIVIEQIFSMPGVGVYLSTAISNRDYPVLQGSIIVMSVFIAIVMLLVDLIYAYVDPRIKAQYMAQSKRSRRIKSDG